VPANIYESVGVTPQIMSAIVPMLGLAGTYFLEFSEEGPGITIVPRANKI
jgi:hypothetical protein